MSPTLALLLAWLLASSPLDSLLRALPADSLVVPLRRFEAFHGRDREGGLAAFELGQLHYARGEYRRAAEAFTRAAARLDPSRKDEARYWVGLCRLALHEPVPARAALEEVAAAASPRRAEAMLGIALAWEMAQRPDRAYDVLERLLDGDPGEAGPLALERRIALAIRLHRAEDARRARTRLLRDYPRSIEAARAGAPEPEATASGSVTVEVGRFSRSSRARALVASAHRAGFADAKVVVAGEGAARSHVVRLGVYDTAAEARKAGERAARRLGVTYRIVESR